MGKVAKTSRNKTYSATALEKCLQEIRQKVPINTACRRYGIPRSTVKFKLSSKCKHQARSGPPTVLCYAEEKDLADWIKKMARKGFPVTKYRVINVVTDYLENNPGRNTFKNGKPSPQWINSYLDRFKELSVRTPESVTNASANVTELDIRRWFKEVRDLLEEDEVADILQDPRRVLNGDEACFYLDPAVDKVIANRGERNVYKVDQGPAKKNITVMFTCSADGNILPPLVVLPYKKIPMEVTQSIPAEWGIGKTDSGWMTKGCFLHYIKKILHPQLAEKNLLPVVYFVDGHSSHTPWETAEECLQLGIILVCLYANCTRILQPLDVAVFKPLKVAWLKAVDDWKCANPDRYIKSEHFAPLLSSAMKVIDEQIVKNGFQACGLFPWDADRVDYSKCLAKTMPPTADVDDIDPHATKPAKKSRSPQGTTFPVLLSKAEAVLKLLGKDRVSRYKQAEVEFASDDDKIIYCVYEMLQPLESRVFEAEVKPCDAHESAALEEGEERMVLDPGHSDGQINSDDKLESRVFEAEVKSCDAHESSALEEGEERMEIDPGHPDGQINSDDELVPPPLPPEKLVEDNNGDASDSDGDLPLKTDPLLAVNDAQFEMVLLSKQVAQSHGIKQEPKAGCSGLADFLKAQTPDTPHRKGTHRFKHRSPPVLTSRRRLEYHKMLAEQKAAAEAEKRQKAEKRAQKKAEIAAAKRAKSELTKNRTKKAPKSKKEIR